MPFVGEVRIFGGNFAPTGWAFCDGQLLSIVSNTALFSLLGTRFGGNGTTTFGLPDLRGRTPIGSGQGPGLTTRIAGQAMGSESHTLTTPETPAHTHALRAASSNGTTDRPAGQVMARSAAGIPHYGPTADVNLAAAAVGTSGGGQPHNNMQPYLTLNYIIALQGIYPPRP